MFVTMTVIVPVLVFFSDVTVFMLQFVSVFPLTTSADETFRFRKFDFGSFLFCSRDV